MKRLARSKQHGPIFSIPRQERRFRLVRQRRRAPLPLVLAAWVSSLLTPTFSAADSLLVNTIQTSVQQITSIAQGGDARLFLASKEGRVHVYQGGQVLGTPFLDIRGRVRSVSGFDDERGLLGLAFHPNFASNGYFYVAYTSSDTNSRVSRFRASPPGSNQADSGSELILLNVPQAGVNHNVDHLAFGPDGYLYISAGDGGFEREPVCTGQQKDNLLGKILRIDVDSNSGSLPYGIPSDNPFVGEPGARGEIWAMGLRNPWRFSFDRQTGDLLLADVGHGTREEVNFQPASSRGGENYGFKMLEGRNCRGSSQGCGFTLPPCGDPGYTAPIFDYGHDSRHCAVVGGIVYRGSRIPSLVGTYLFGDFCGAVSMATRSGSSWQVTDLTGDIPALTTFGEDTDGELYIAAGSTLFEVVGIGESGNLTFAAPEISAPENGGPATVAVTREGGSDGAITVDYSLSPGTASPGLDYQDVAGTLAWGDGEGGQRSFQVPILDDGTLEGDETATLRLSSPSGGAGLGGLSTSTLRIVDDDVPAGACVLDDVTLCLQDGRFQLRLSWRSPQGDSGMGQAETFTDATGYFWFFDPTNVEIVVKLLDACGDPFDRFWVFAAGLTNVEVEMSVFDTEARILKVYRNPLGTAFQPIQDTQAFDTCP